MKELTLLKIFLFFSFPDRASKFQQQNTFKYHLSKENKTGVLLYLGCAIRSSVNKRGSDTFGEKGSWLDQPQIPRNKSNSWSRRRWWRRKGNRKGPRSRFSAFVQEIVIMVTAPSITISRDQKWVLRISWLANLRKTMNETVLEKNASHFQNGERRRVLEGFWRSTYRKSGGRKASGGKSAEFNFVLSSTEWAATRFFIQRLKFNFTNLVS